MSGKAYYPISSADLYLCSGPSPLVKITRKMHILSNNSLACAVMANGAKSSSSVHCCIVRFEIKRGKKKSKGTKFKNM
jgi:hypothetical protein